MTAKMLNRQSMKAHKESEVQKAKVKKVPSDPPAWDAVVRRASGTMQDMLAMQDMLDDGGDVYLGLGGRAHGQR